MTEALPVFTIERLTLRRRNPGDLDALCAMHADPEVMAFIFDGSVPEPKAHRAALLRRLEHDFGPGQGVWSVLEGGAQGHFLGWVALHPLPDWAGEVEIGWRFARTAWGHGYATEAAGVLMAHGFDTLGLGRIVAVLNGANSRSRRLCERLGMTEHGEREAYGGPCTLYARERAVTCP